MSVVMRSGARRQLGDEQTGQRVQALQYRVRAAVRRCIAEEVERLVNMLDVLDGDADMEEEPDREDGGDAEPSIGWTITMAWGSTNDDEEPLSIVSVEREASPAAARARAGDALEVRTERNEP